MVGLCGLVLFVLCKTQECVFYRRWSENHPLIPEDVAHLLHIGIIASQGARSDHSSLVYLASKECGIDVEVRMIFDATDLDGCAAVIAPGGESTTMRLVAGDLFAACWSMLRRDSDVGFLGTCAGLILAASPGDEGPPLLDVDIERNGWGRQRDSFTAVLQSNLDSRYSSQESDSAWGSPPLGDGRRSVGITTLESPPRQDEVAFIRAPRIRSMGPEVEGIAWLEDEVVGVRQHGNRFGLTFHPELTGVLTYHVALLEACLTSREVTL